MSRSAPLAIARSVSFALTIALAATGNATSHAQAAQKEASSRVTRRMQSDLETFGPAHGPGAGGKRWSKELSTTDQAALPEFQLILPDLPSCWSHSRAENPQGSQDNGEHVQQRKRGFVRSNISADPLLGPFVQESADQTNIGSRSRTANFARPHSRVRVQKSRGTLPCSKVRKKSGPSAEALWIR